MLFKDRRQAGEMLAQRLQQYSYSKDTLVLAIPRGGVVVAAEIAKKLNLPLDIVVTRKIGSPTQPELALGAVDPNGDVVWDEKLLGDLGLKIDDLRSEVENQLEEIKRREKLYRQGKSFLNIQGKSVILVDDGIATGATVIAAVKYLKKLKVAKIILAVPVAVADVAEEIDEFIDEKVILEVPDYLGAVGSFYQNFEPVEDEEVIKLLK